MKTIAHVLKEQDNSANSSESDSDTSTIEREDPELVAQLTGRKKTFKAIVDAIRSKGVHKLRLDGTLEEYKLYCELCYPGIVGKQKWKLNYCHVAIKTLTTVADEALVALLLENNIEEWVSIAKGGTIPANGRKTLYTHGGRGAVHTKKGWSLEGRQRYNTLHAEVKKVRNDTSANVSDESLKRAWNPNNSQTQRNVQQDDESTQLSERMEEEFKPAFDFDD